MSLKWEYEVQNWAPESESQGFEPSVYRLELTVELGTRRQGLKPRASSLPMPSTPSSP